MSIFSAIDTALDNLKLAYREDSRAVTEHDTVDHSRMILENERMERLLKRQRKVYKFLGVTKEEFEMAIERGTGKKRKIRHIVTSYDTLFSIANNYKVDADVILQTNNITSGQITAGTTIIIEADSEEITGNAVTRDLPIIAEHKGKELLGRDLADTILNESSGDLSVLNPDETLYQGMKIRLNARKGDYPFKPDFGIDTYFNVDLPNELRMSMIDAEAQASLESDPRVKEILAINLIESMEPETAGNIEITAEVTTIA